MRYGSLATSVRALVPATLFLTALTASADGPAPPAGAIPSASQLQQAHDLGQNIASNHFDAEVVPYGQAPPKDLVRHRFDEYLKTHGSRLSEAEKEVFTEAYWNKFDKRTERYDPSGGIPNIDPPNLTGASPTTVVSGKTTTPGPGTLQLTDAKGNSYFVDVDANGNYSTTVPQSGFEPTKMTLRTGTMKAAWELKDGKWTQIASATGTPGIQGAMAPTRGAAVQQVAYFDECEQYAVIGSFDRESVPVATRPNSWLLPVRFVEPREPFSGRPGKSAIRLVGGPLTPQEVQTLTDLGAKVGDLEHQISELDKQLQNPNLSDTQKNDLNNQRTELNNSKGRNEGTARDQYGSNREAKDVFEKAKEARKKQRELEEAERKAAQNPNDKKAQRTVNRLKLELQDLQRGIGTLPPLAMGALTPGTGGSATDALAQASGAPPTGMGAAIAQMGTYTIKGTAKMGSAVGIPKGTIATGVMLAPHETPGEFVKLGTGDDVQMSATLGGSIVRDRLWVWGAYTTNQDPPPVVEVGANGVYQYDYKVGADYGLGKNLGLGVKYEVALSAGYNRGCAKQSFGDLAAGKEMPTTAIEDRSQLIKGLKPGANLWQVDDAFVSHGLGHIDGWDPWESPNSTFTPRTWFAYKIAEADIPKFNSFGSMYFPIIGYNFGINTAPAPAWRPENWPNDHPKGIPTARVSRNGGRP